MKTRLNMIVCWSNSLLRKTSRSSTIFVRKCSCVHSRTGALSLKVYALVKNRGSAKGLSIGDVRASWNDSNCKDCYHSDSARRCPESENSTNSDTEVPSFTEKKTVTIFHDELKGELEKTPNHTDLPSVLDSVVSSCGIVDSEG